MTIGDCQYGCIAVGRHPVFDGILVRKPRADMRASPAACAGRAPSDVSGGLSHKF